MYSPSIEIKNLKKVFRKGKIKATVAVNCLNMKVEKGEILGLVGPNGAGKTTTLRIISTILKPTEGDVFVKGNSVTKNPERVRKIIGFLTGETKLYDRLTPREIFYYFGRLYSTGEKRIEERIEEIISILHLEEIMNRRISVLSEGMKQKISIGRTIIHNPDILILDEPLTGLDIFARQSIADFIRESKKQGKTVLFSTHVMGEVEELCDRVGFLYRGSLLDVGRKEKIKKKYGMDTIGEIFMELIRREDAKDMDNN